MSHQDGGNHNKKAWVPGVVGECIQINGSDGFFPPEGDFYPVHITFFPPEGDFYPVHITLEITEYCT